MKRITKIEENKALSVQKKIRVAAYCRVSTASDEQLISLEAQKHVMRITSNPMVNGSMQGYFMTRASRV